MGLDAAQENDCFAVVIVSMSAEHKPQVRYCQVWTPREGQPISFLQVEEELIKLFKQFNIAEVAYDPHDMPSTAERLGQHVFVKKFQQGEPRLIADKRLYDMIRDRRIEHDGSYPILRQHIINADRKPDDDKLRIIKRIETLKIDAVVALSMAIDRAMRYNL